MDSPAVGATEVGEQGELLAVRHLLESWVGVEVTCEVREVE